MISRRTSRVPKEDVLFPRLLHCVSRGSRTCRWGSRACCQCSQDCRWHSQASCQHSQVLHCATKGISGARRFSQTYHIHSHGTSVPVIRDPSYTEGQQECPPRVWYSPEIEVSKFSLHILSDTPGGSQWLKYIVLMMYQWLHWAEEWFVLTMLEAYKIGSLSVSLCISSRW